MPKSALIAGSTGLVGSDCLQFLLASPEYASVTALVRKGSGISHPKLLEQLVDFESLGNFPGSDDVFCALGTTIKKAGSQPAFRRVDLEYPLLLAERSLTAGAKQFLLVSSVGANAKSGNFYLHTKGELEDALQRLPFVSLHIFRPSFLVGERKEKRTGEHLGMVLAEALKFTMVGALRKYRSIRAATVAQAMVKAAALGNTGVHIYEHDDILRLAEV
ncbi:MAG: oxidoreductase [Acidobacteria bacterium]|nr:MAG: oxidoreductase [Acidobacteriota bacterium]PYY21808.1 MAG: oxidoreductase [Acidobacteriota bacterium]